MGENLRNHHTVYQDSRIKEIFREINSLFESSTQEKQVFLSDSYNLLIIQTQACSDNELNPSWFPRIALFLYVYIEVVTLSPLPGD